MPRPYNACVGVGHARPRFRETKFRPGEPIRVDPRRRSLRLPGFDYSTLGAYFIAICARDRRCILDEVADVVTACWNEIPQHFPHVSLDAFVVMPNHIHGILILCEVQSLSVVVGSFKAAVSKQLRRTIWQRNYWEHII